MIILFYLNVYYYAYLSIYFLYFNINYNILKALLRECPNKVLREATVKRRCLKKLIFNYRNVIDVVKLYKVLEPGSHLG